MQPECLACKYNVPLIEKSYGFDGSIYYDAYHQTQIPVYKEPGRSLELTHYAYYTVGCAARPHKEPENAA